MNKNIAVILMVGVLGCGGSGANGTNGSDATATKISSETNCTKSSDTGTGTTLSYVYESVTLSSGDRFVSCSVQTNIQQYSNTVFYKSTDVGATTGGCTVDYNFDASASSSIWFFNSQSGASSVRYSSAASAHNGYTYNFSSANCSTN